MAETRPGAATSRVEMISVLVPIYNEEGNIFPLVEAVHAVMQRNGYRYEISDSATKA
jgi:hypothetical protein